MDNHTPEIQNKEHFTVIFFFPSNIWTNKPPNVFTQFKRVRKSSILIKNAVWLLNFPSNILLPFHENSERSQLLHQNYVNPKTGTDILLPTISLAALLSSRVSKYIQYEVTWNSVQYGCFEIISFLFIHLFIRFVCATIERQLCMQFYIYIYIYCRGNLLRNFQVSCLFMCLWCVYMSDQYLSLLLEIFVVQLSVSLWPSFWYLQ